MTLIYRVSHDYGVMIDYSALQLAYALARLTEEKNDPQRTYHFNVPLLSTLKAIL